MSDPAAWSFLAEDAADWRAVLLFDVAARTGLLDTTGTVEELAQRHALDPRAVRALLEGLVSFGFAESADGDVYRVGDGGTAASTIRHHADVIRQWSLMEERLAEPVIDRRPGRSGKDLARWLDALATGARDNVDWVVETCLQACPGAASALDLGGGHGVYSVGLARRGVSTVIQDRPGVIEIVTPEMERQGVAVLAGDFHEVLPDREFDLVLLAGVAHTMAPERLSSLYRRLRGVVRPGGALVVMAILGGTRRRRRVFSIQMLTVGNGGGTFSAAEHLAWLADAGFEDVVVQMSDDDRADVIVAR